MSTASGAIQRGVSLVELIVFIVVVSAAVAGVLVAFTQSTRSSADPMIQKQALSIAEALLEEVQLQPFTYCDPDDDNAVTATRAKLDSAVTPPDVGCATTIEVLGAEGGESRTSTTTPYDNVNDYQAGGGLVLSGISDITGSPITGLGSYTATITVGTQALGAISGTDALDGAPQSLLISVTVNGPGNTTVALHGYRIRYAPNALP